MPPPHADEKTYSVRDACVEVLDDEMVRLWRSKTPAEKLAIANGMWRSARDMLRNLLRAEHPDWTEEQVTRETARRLSHGAC